MGKLPAKYSGNHVAEDGRGAGSERQGDRRDAFKQASRRFGRILNQSPIAIITRWQDFTEIVLASRPFNA